jgi:hypothetical protein
MQLAFLIVAAMAIAVALWRWWPSKSIWPADMTQAWHQERERATYKDGWRL